MDSMVRRFKFLLTLLLFSFLFVGFSNPTMDIEQARREVVQNAMNIYNSGAKYVWGATGQNNTYDCSGYTQVVMKQAGINHSAANTANSINKTTLRITQSA